MNSRTHARQRESKQQAAGSRQRGAKEKKGAAGAADREPEERNGDGVRSRARKCGGRGKRRAVWKCQPSSSLPTKRWSLTAPLRSHCVTSLLGRFAFGETDNLLKSTTGEDFAPLPRPPCTGPMLVSVSLTLTIRFL